MRRLPVARLVLLALVILTGIGLFLVLSPSTPIIVPPEASSRERP